MKKETEKSKHNRVLILGGTGSEKKVAIHLTEEIFKEWDRQKTNNNETIQIKKH